MISNFVEYAVLLLTVVMILQMFCVEKKLKETNPGYKAYLETKESFLVYKSPLSSEIPEAKSEGPNPEQDGRNNFNPLPPVPLKCRRARKISTKNKKRELDFAGRCLNNHD